MSIASIFVNLGLRHENFIANIKESKEHAEGFRESIHSNFGAAQGYLEAFFIIDVFEKFKEGLEKAIEYGAQLNALADRAGVTTQAFQGLRFAAGEAGVGSEAFQTGMQRLTRTLGDAKAGSDKATSALAEIGITAKEIADLTPEDALKRLADAAGKIEDPARRAHIEVALLGRGGQEMDPLLRQGAGAIEEARNKAREFGLTLSEGQADKLRDLANAGRLVHEAIDAGLAKGFADNAEGLSRLAEAAGHAAAKLEKVVQYAAGFATIAKRDGILFAIKDDIDFPSEVTANGTTEGRLAFDRRRLATARARSAKSFDYDVGQVGGIDFRLSNRSRTNADLTDAQDYLGTDTDDALKDSGSFLLKKKNAIVGVGDGSDDAKTKVSAFEAALARLNKTNAELAVRLAAIKENLPAEEIALLTKRAADYADITEKGSKYTETQRGQLLAVADAAYKNGEAIRAATHANEQALAVEKDLAEVRHRLLATEFKPVAFAAYKTDITAFNKSTLGELDHFLNDAHREFVDVGRNFFGDLSNGLGAVITGSAKLGDVLVQSFERAAAALIASKIFELIGSIAIGGGETIGSFFHFGGPRAAGGSVEAGKAYLVGEHGPELRTDLGNGQIIPNDALRGMAGGHQNVAVSVDVQPSPLFATVVGTAVAQGSVGAADAQRRAQRQTIARGRG